MPRTFVATLLVLMACAGRQGGKNTSAAPAISQTSTRVSAPGATAGQTTTLEGTAAPSANTAVLRADRAAVWKELPAVYEEFGIPLTKVDAESYVIGNEGLKVSRRLKGVPLSRYLRCGDSQGMPNADTYDVLLAVVTQLRPTTDGGTQVATTVDAAARPTSFNTTNTVACASSGALERRLHDRLAARVKTGS